MAKGNLFLGMGRGKIGDVVFYRFNGQQMARVRNRKPKNPRTNEQLYQRAIIATVMKAYSAGKEIFDHSFQNIQFGEGNMRYFNSKNARMLRSNLANDLASGLSLENQLGRFVAPGVASPVAVPGLIASEGELTNNFMRIVAPTSTANVAKVFVPVVLENETIQEFLTRMNIYPGDIFTIIAFTCTKNNIAYKDDVVNTPYANQYDTAFGWLRLIVKDMSDSDLKASETTHGDLFEFQVGGSGVRASASQKLGVDYDITTHLTSNNAMGTVAIIRSRDDEKTRSSETMKPITFTKEYGIASQYLLLAWTRGTEKIGQSELILEGGDGPGTAAAVITERQNIIGEPVPLLEDGEDLEKEIETETKRRSRR